MAKSDRVMNKCWIAARDSNLTLLNALKEEFPDQIERIEFLFEHHKEVMEQLPHLKKVKLGAKQT